MSRYKELIQSAALRHPELSLDGLLRGFLLLCQAQRLSEQQAEALLAAARAQGAQLMSLQKAGSLFRSSPV